jgi:SAM-dependent methyltransferase
LRASFERCAISWKTSKAVDPLLALRDASSTDPELRESPTRCSGFGEGDVVPSAIDWRRIWESKAAEPDFTASGRSSSDPGQLFALLADACTALAPTAEDTLLDVGCGVGMLARHLAPYVHRLVAMDFAPSLIGRARAHVPSGRFAAASIQSLPFRDGAFSKVLVSSVLQYLEDDGSVARALAEIRHVTAAHGRAFASGNPDERKKEEYIAGIDHLDIPEERKVVIRERNRQAYWMSQESLLRRAEEAGWQAEVRPISPSVWQSSYMFDLLLIAR